MSYDELEELCRKSGEEEDIYLCIDGSKKRCQGRFGIRNESKNNESGLKCDKVLEKIKNYD